MLTRNAVVCRAFPVQSFISRPLGNTVIFNLVFFFLGAPPLPFLLLLRLLFHQLFSHVLLFLQLFLYWSFSLSPLPPSTSWFLLLKLLIFFFLLLLSHYLYSHTSSSFTFFSSNILSLATYLLLIPLSFILLPIILFLYFFLLLFLQCNAQWEQIMFFFGFCSWMHLLPFNRSCW